jgi:O-antigen/teichoic acid export membrane protein
MMIANEQVEDVDESLPIATPQPLFGLAMRGLAIASGADLLIKIVGFIATAIILYQISPYQYGLWQLLLSIITAFSISLFPSIGGMLVADIARYIGVGEKKKANALLLRSALFFALLGALSSLAMFFAAPYLTSLSGLQLTNTVRLLALSLVIAGIGQGLTMILQTRLEFVNLQASKVIGRASYLACIALSLLIFHLDLMGLVYSYLVATILPTLVFAPYLVRAYRRMLVDYAQSSWGEFFIELKSRGPWVIFSDVVSGFYGTLWPWLVGYFLGIPAVGIITIALTFLSQVSTFVPISAVLRPMLPRTAGEAWRIEHWVTRSMKYALWLNVIFGLGAFFAACLVFPLFFPKYVAALPLCAALLISLPFRALGTVATEWFYTTGRQKDLFIFSKLFGLSMLVLMIPLLAFGGMFGYVLDIILSADILLVARLRVMRRKGGIRINLKELFFVDSQDGEYLKRIVDGIMRRLSRFYA